MSIIKPLEEIVISKKGEIEKKEFFSKEYVEGYYPIISAGKEIKGYYKFNNRKKGIICISSSGANAGFITIPNSDFFASDCFTLEPKDTNQLLQKFLNYKIFSIKKIINYTKQGSAQPHVYFKNLAKLKLYFPPINIQKSIIDIIEPIENVENMIEKLMDLIHKILFKISITCKETKILLKEKVNFNKGKSLKSENFKQNGVPFIDIRMLNSGRITKYVKETQNIKMGDVLLSLDGTTGIVKINIEGFNGYAYKIESNLISNYEIFLNLIHSKNQKIIKSNSKGTTIMHASSAKEKLLYFELSKNLKDYLNNLYNLIINLEKIKLKIKLLKSLLIKLLIK